MSDARIVVDGQPIAFEPGDSIAIAIVRSGAAPGRGGTLCLAGDCGNCLGVVDGIAYVRTCQVPARPGIVIERHPADGNPPLPVDGAPRDIPVARSAAGVLVIGAGDGGRRVEADRDDALVVDEQDGDEVVGIYAGPTVIVRRSTGMLHVEVDEVVVATGAAEIQPVCQGNDLDGLLTVRAAERLRDAGVELEAPVVTVGRELWRFEGDASGRVRAVVTHDAAGAEATL